MTMSCSRFSTPRSSCHLRTDCPPVRGRECGDRQQSRVVRLQAKGPRIRGPLCDRVLGMRHVGLEATKRARFLRKFQLQGDHGYQPAAEFVTEPFAVTAMGTTSASAAAAPAKCPLSRTGRLA